MAEAVDKVGLIVGRVAPMNPLELTAAEWASVVQTAANSLTMDYIRGLKSAKALIEENPCVCLSTEVTQEQLEALNVPKYVSGFLMCAYLRTLETQSTSQLLLARSPQWPPRAFFILNIGWKWPKGEKGFRLTEASLQEQRLEDVFADAGDNAEKLALGLSVLRNLRAYQKATADDLREREAKAYRSARKIHGFLERLGATEPLDSL